jgi:hypothetical protein
MRFIIAAIPEKGFSFVNRNSSFLLGLVGYRLHG